ncbi:MAG: hypothetical protein K2N34_14690 [Lachnospiraceae bacterium]|nr:hypothetical protein [Lachnospiraceae bacterium]
MGEVYHEWLIKRKMTVTGIALRVLFVLMCIASVLLTVVFGPISFVVGVALAYLTRFIFQMTDIEYEYMYLSGECQVDKICGKMRRKGCGKIEMDKVEIIAPEGHEDLAQYEKQVYKLRDFSSLEKDANRYIVFERKDSSLIKVIFEPNEDIIKEMQLTSPRKVFLNAKKKI